MRVAGELFHERTLWPAFLDLHDRGDRERFERLIAGAHVMVHGLRSNAINRLGFGAGRRRELNPSLLDVSHDAYGFTGPWSRRRGLTASFK
jgi:crotonobetainyl-CoA:carnitine CoA-transferase CaiB-like acyl-CoA transferase